MFIELNIIKYFISLFDYLLAVLAQLVVYTLIPKRIDLHKNLYCVQFLLYNSTPLH